MQGDTRLWRRVVPVREIALILALGVAACVTVSGGGARESNVLRASAPVVEVWVGESKESWTLSAGQNPDVYTIIVPRGERREVRFVSGGRSLSRAVALGEKADFIIHFNGVEYPTRIVGAAPMAQFDETYQNAHRGRIEVERPEVYELVNIAIAMTPTGRASKYLVARESPYYDAATAWFMPFADHPFVAALDRELVARRYFEIKMNAFSFAFGANDRIVRSAVYDRTGFSGSTQNTLAPYLGEMQAFADASRFREFFRNQQGVYRAQEAYFRERINLSGMLDWLRLRFPKMRAYDGYKIVFSPLVGGSQSVTWLESNGYRELQAHVNFPYPQPGDAQLSAEAAAFRRGEIAFTELNHGFINPAAAPYRDQITRTFADRAFWTKAGTSADSYGNAMSVFLELMNWALVALYAEDVVPSAERGRLVAALDDSMGDSGRGFTRFAPFRAELLRLYRNRSAGASVESLYPQILAWCESYRLAHEAALRRGRRGTGWAHCCVSSPPVNWDGRRRGPW